MALLSKADLLQVVVRAVQSSGWSVLYLAAEHPFRLLIHSNDQSVIIRSYMWNLTHGGGAARPQDEYRIQITGVSRFEPEPTGKTLILGWWDDVGVFAAFDLRRHTGPLGASPSMQIREEYLRRARAHRFAACPKENGELAIAFAPEFFVGYVQNLEALHDFGESETDLQVLDAVSVDPRGVNEAIIGAVAAPRREAIRAVRTRLRSADFQTRVLAAYDHHCAVCHTQLRLVEAAHILPVSYPGSADLTCNGLALCTLHHRAYDDALIAVNDDYRVMVNATRLQRLASERRAAGREAFVAALKAVIALPQEISDRPHIDYLREANTVRGWKEVEIRMVG